VLEGFTSFDFQSDQDFGSIEDAVRTYAFFSGGVRLTIFTATVAAAFAGHAACGI
jgi:hypothetical protein